MSASHLASIYGSEQVRELRAQSADCDVRESVRRRLAVNDAHS